MLDIQHIDVPVIRSRSHLVENLRFMYALIVASEDLTLLAAHISGLPYFFDKAREEIGHAQWLKDDISEMGEEAPRVDHDAACIAGSQFYYIKYVSPLMLLGYMAALECNPMPMGDVERLEKTYGRLPTLRYHAEHDLLHGRDVLAEIEKIPDPDLRLKIAYNARCTKAHIARVMQSRFEGCENAVRQ